MPSLFSSSASGSGGLRSMSRVNSFKREWDDDETPKANGSSSQVDWSPSPEAVHRKKVLVEYPSAPAPPAFDPLETPADRRRKAILAAMSENTSLSSTSLPPQQSSNNFARHRPIAEKISAVQQLPSVPVREIGGSGASEKKRSLPWEQGIEDTKKAMRSTSTNSNTSDGTKRAKTASSAASHINIAQKMTLSVEQQKVLALVVAEGKNIFFTGSAGTGKSVLLREIIKALRKKYATAPDAVAVTASTGIAACNIGGVTLHSFGGIGLGIEEVNVLAGKVRKNKKASARWMRTKVLIIDEVSMVDGELFDKFCKIGQMLRKTPGKPWGGIQIIVTGDFFQLPPVTKGNQTPRFCFEAATWDETIELSVNLTKVFRQKDQTFVNMLNEMRFGNMQPASIDAFRQLGREIKYTDGIAATELFPRREDVDRSNHSRLTALNTDGWSYNAADTGTAEPVQREKLLSNFMAAKHIQIKVDAQVMLIKNLDESLVNGSMGIVKGFCHKQLWDTDTKGEWLQRVDLSELNEEDQQREEKRRALLHSKLSGSTPLPVVRFKVPEGFRDQIIDFEQFKVELPNGEVQAARTQVPLILAWAMSIHKSQGQTLERVKVDLSKVFEKGQAYVALSRATSMEGLQVLGFSASKVQAHRKVANWSTQLRSLD